MDLQKKWMNVLLVLEVLMLAVVLIFGALSYGKRLIDGEGNKPGPGGSDLLVDGTGGEGSSSDDSSSQEEDRSVSAFSQAVLNLLGNMTLEEKVAQLFITTPEALTGADQVTVARSTSQNAFQTYPVGGLLFSQRNHTGSTQFKELLDGYQEFSNSVLGVKLFVFGEGLSQDAVNQGVNSSLDDYNTLSPADGQEAVAAIKEGVDFLYVPVDFKTVYAAVLEAVGSGELEEAVIEQAAGKVMSLKTR